MYEAVELTYSQLTNALQLVQQALASINDQEVELSLSISIKGKPIQEQPEQTWKALAEAHLRERVKNPHDYRALSIELEGMKNAGFPWEKDFNHNLSQMVRFINKLYQAQLVPSALWNSIESVSDRHLYRIQEATDYWRNFR